MFRPKSKLYPPCKKHPKHKQSPGVCSICLNEKLSHLSSSTSPPPRVSSSPSSLSSLSSSDISSCVSSRMSPMRDIQRCVASEARASKYSFRRDYLVSQKGSIVVFGRPIDRTEGDEHHDDVHSMKGKEKKRRGFWSNFLTSQPTPTTNDPHLHRVIDQQRQSFIYSQPLTS